jgi:peptide/nickel transport system ATP-binding protein
MLDGEQRTLIDHVSFDLGKGEILGLVGESGSGKSMICRALVKLLPSKAIAITGGSVMLGGRDLVALDEAAMRSVRGAEIGMVFQNPTSHLDPVMRIGDQIAEGIRYHQGKSRREAKSAAIDILASGRLSQSGAAIRQLSARILRRHAPARHDRGSALL